MTTKNKDDLAGFEEYIDSLDGNSNKGDRLDKVPRSANINEHLSLLINDQERLKKMSYLLCKRLPQYDKYPQSEQLVKTENYLLTKTKADLIEMIKKDGSTLHQNLMQIIDSFFKS